MIDRRELFEKLLFESRKRLPDLSLDEIIDAIVFEIDRKEQEALDAPNFDDGSASP